MGKSKHGRIDGQFVPVLATTLDSPAWKATSHGAKVLFVNLKRKVPREDNRAYLSYRDAGAALGNGPHKIREWFSELEHYGFIVLAVPHSLGPDGVGKAPHWRLTELGSASRKNPDGLPEYPTRDFLRWDGVLFDPKPFRYGRKWDYEKQNPVVHVDNTPLSTSTTPPLSTSTTPKSESVVDVADIADEIGVVHADDISSLTTTVVSPTLSPAPPPTSPEGPSEEENHVAPNNVVNFDERIASLEATEKKRRLR